MFLFIFCVFTSHHSFHTLYTLTVLLFDRPSVIDQTTVLEGTTMKPVYVSFKRSPHVCADFFLLLLLSLLPSPAFQKTVRKVRGVKSHLSDFLLSVVFIIILPHFLRFLSCFSLQSVTCFHSYSSISTAPLLLSFLIHVHFSLISSQTSRSSSSFFFFLVLLHWLTAHQSCSLFNRSSLLPTQVFSKLLEPVRSRLAWPISLLSSFPSGATLGLQALSPLNNNYKKTK